ncbi:MAG: L,D-transpeptidase family protein [Chthoniobacterales bacterium]
MNLRPFAIVFAALIATSFGAMQQPSFHTKGSPTGKPTGKMKPGEYWWNPQLSPSGPVVVLVSIPQQMMHVYRNGVLIGRSTISSGSNGHSTPGGVFSILEKKQEHRSKKYNDAPMPFMQRLTWDGIAMHSGQLPGYAASHGCVRLPYDFSALLFQVTSSGGTVVVGNGKTPTPYFAANPAMLLAPKDFKPGMLRPLANGDYDWNPERSSAGPITIVLSSADKALYVYRNGNAIGRGALETKGKLGESVFTMLEGAAGRPSQLAPGRDAGKWMSVGGRSSPEKIESKIRFSPDFANKIAEEIRPGTTVLVTDKPVVRDTSADGYFTASR